MRILLKDGTVKDVGMLAAGVGYVATEITITDADAKQLLATLRRNPKDFIVYMMQFLHRFPSNRV